MSDFKPTGSQQPPKSANGQASMCYSPVDETLYFFVPSNAGGIEVWAWTGSGWRPYADGIFQETYSGRPLAAFGDGDVHVFRTTEHGIRLARLAALDDEVTLEAPGLDARSSHGLAGFNPTTDRFLVCCPLRDDSKTYAFDGESLELICEGPYLMSGCWDEANQRLVGVDVSGRGYYLGAGGWQSFELGLGSNGSDIAYDPTRERVVALLAESDDEMQLYGANPDDRAEPLGPRMRPYIASAALGVDPGRNQVLSVGGQDFRKQGGWSDETWVSTNGDDFVSTQSGSDLAIGRYNTPVHMGDSLLVVNHSTLEVNKAVADGWETIVEPIDHQQIDGGYARLDDRMINFCASPVAVFMLDADGALWRAQPGGTWNQIEGPGEGPDARYARRLAMAFDPTSNRLVVFGGVENNDTWVHDTQQWRKLDDPVRPAAGIASAAATPSGLYLLAGKDLWVLDDDAWRCVGSDDSVWVRGLLYDRRLDALFTFDGGHPNAHMYTWTASGWEQIATLPERVMVRDTMSGVGAEAGLDSEHRRFHLLHDEMNYTLDIDALDLDGATRPTGEVPPAEATTEAPDEHLATTLAIETTGKYVTLGELNVDVVVPDGWKLLALLPSHPSVPQLEGYSGVAVMMVENYWESDEFEPWRLGGGGIECRLLQGDAPSLALASFDAPEGHLELAEYRPQTELSPDVLDEYHTTRGEAPLNRTKLGGLPSFIQGDPLEFDNERGLAYLGQLAADVYDCEFGDVGSVYMFIGPNGATDAVMQSH
jgi:hypothetical protein